MIKFRTWNIRGLNASEKKKKVDYLLRSHEPSYCILVEMRVKKQKRDKIMRKRFNCWKLIDNYNNHENGRIWGLYREDMLNLNIIQCSD